MASSNRSVLWTLSVRIKLYITPSFCLLPKTRFVSVKQIYEPFPVVLPIQRLFVFLTVQMASCIFTTGHLSSCDWLNQIRWLTIHPLWELVCFSLINNLVVFFLFLLMPPFCFLENLVCEKCFSTNYFLNFFMFIYNEKKFHSIFFILALKKVFFFYFLWDILL
jgi:hypothetical protein